MELVYLWVEKYKNIHRQGFNFSPRFAVEFIQSYYKIGNNEGGLDDKLSARSPLSIIPKTSESLFPQNVNITAIVGKNGTGKSRILKLLYTLYNNSSTTKNCFAIFYDNKIGEHFYLGDAKKFKCLESCKPLSCTAFALFDYSLTYSPEFTYEKDALIYPKKQIGSAKGVISLTQELIHNQKNILLNYFELEKCNQLDKFKDFFVPDKIVVEWNNARFQNKINNFHKNKGLLEAKNQEIQTAIQNIEVGQTLKDFITNLKSIQNILNDQNSYEKKEPIDFDNPFIPNWFQWCERLEEDNQINNFWHNNFTNAQWDTFANNTKLTPQKLYKEIAEDGENNAPSYEVLSYEVKNLQTLIETILTSFGQEYFTIKLIDKNEKVLNDLSFGEQQLVFILNQLFALKYEKFSGIEKVEDEKGQIHECEVSENIQNYILLLDEIDVGFHPDWQKKSISYICDFLKLLPSINFHLVFATHSPFILSDLPKENVIFLDKYKENDIDVQSSIQKVDNCKQVYPFKESEQTFGANIHTLLSHGFFMDKGLMGEFAKEKITAIKEFYDDVIKYKDNKDELVASKCIYDDKKDKFWKIQGIIGEPFLKTIIKNYLDELEQMFDTEEYKTNKKKELLKQFSEEELEKYLESLKNAKA